MGVFIPKKFRGVGFKSSTERFSQVDDFSKRKKNVKILHCIPEPTYPDVHLRQKGYVDIPEYLSALRSQLDGLKSYADTLPLEINLEKYIKKCERQREIETCMGPGTYEIGPVKEGCGCGSYRGYLQTLEPRFRCETLSYMTTPGPGNYGPRGIPYYPRLTSKERFGNISLMNNTGRGDKALFGLVGSGLGPGTYKYERYRPDQEYKLKKGPIALVKSKKMENKIGHLVFESCTPGIPATDNLKGALYETINGKCKVHNGHFFIADRFPRLTGKRNEVKYGPLRPYFNGVPGPNRYYPKEPVYFIKGFHPAFNIASTERIGIPINKQSGAPGRYHIDRCFKYIEAPISITSPFKCKVSRKITREREKTLGERLRDKDIPPDEKMAIISGTRACCYLKQCVPIPICPE